MSKHNSEKFDLIQFIAELIRTVVIVVVLAFLIRQFVMQPYIVDGSSMYPVLHNNDYLLVDKIGYKIKDPQRGDIIVFKYPNNTSVYYVKRIIGLPGEKVRIENGAVYIFNTANPSGLKLDEPYTNGVNNTFVKANETVDNQPITEFTVPENNYFVMGDNRTGSSDSREWGFLNNDKIIGKVFVQAFPFNRAAVIEHARY